MSTVYLDRNESQYGPAPGCYEALKNIGMPQLTQYTRDYTRGVKSRVSERIAEWSGVPEKNIALGYGTEGLLKMAVHKFLHAGEALLVPDASWWYYKAIADEVGGDTYTYQLRRGEDKYYYDTDEMIRAYEASQPKVVFIASPNNPTGNAIAPQELKEVLNAFRDSVVLLDEAYWGYHTQDITSVKSLIESYDNLLVLRTFSKYYALAGVRMGFAFGSDRFSDFVKYTTRYLGYSQMAEDIVLAALDDPEYYEQIRQNMIADMNMYYEELGQFDCVTCYKSDANFLLIRFDPRMIDPLKASLDEVGLRIKFFTEEKFQNCARLSLGTREQNAQVLDCIVDTAKRISGYYGHVA